MELSIKCPDCGKTLKVTVVAEEPQKLEIIKRVKKVSSWSEIANAISSGKAKEILSPKDVIPVELRNGEHINIVVADIDLYNENEVIFTFEDCLSDKHYMNKEATNKGGWKDSDMNKHLNTTVFDLLPDDLKDVITPRKITQLINGKNIESTCKLWLPSMTEVGKECKADVVDKRFAIFEDEKSRVKQIDGETYYWWLRSPNTGSTTDFWNVYNSGGVSGNGANYSFGVCPCFSICYSH